MAALLCRDARCVGMPRTYIRLGYPRRHALQHSTRKLAYADAPSTWSSSAAAAPPYSSPLASCLSHSTSCGRRIKSGGVTARPLAERHGALKAGASPGEGRNTSVACEALSRCDPPSCDHHVRLPAERTVRTIFAVRLSTLGMCVGPSKLVCTDTVSWTLNQVGTHGTTARTYHLGSAGSSHWRPWVRHHNLCTAASSHFPHIKRSDGHGSRLTWEEGPGWTSQE